jgi:hypothetical protein
MNDKCLTCFHRHMSKVVDTTKLNSPCYDCLFNEQMKKTNNYSPGANILAFPIKKIISTDDSTS